MDDIRNSLDEVIKNQIEGLSKLDDGSREKSSAIDDLTKLYKLRTEDQKLGIERDIAEEKLVIQAKDEQNKADQLRESKKDRIVRCVIAGAEIGLPLIFYGFWMAKGLKFEETGTFTSKTFQNLIKFFKPKK